MNWKWKFVLALFVIGLIAIVGLLGAAMVVPVPRPYAFIRSDHPADMWENGKDRWAYYSVGGGTTKALAANVRDNLIHDGYKEDKTQSPWYRFVRDNEEIIICNHDEFSLNGNDLVREDPKAEEKSQPPTAPGARATAREWPCFLVKNGPEKKLSLPFYKVQKMVNGW